MGDISPWLLETKKGMADVPRSGIGTQPEPLKHRQVDEDRRRSERQRERA
jgi:hypothetical protein